MTVATASNRSDYTGNAVATSFAYPGKIFAATDLQVYVAGVLQVLNTDYTVTNVNSIDGGNVVFTTAPADLAAIVILRIVDETQATSLRNQGAYYADSVEDALDRRAMVDIQLQDQLDGAIKQPITEDRLDMSLPLVANRAGKYLAFDSNGLPIPLALTLSAPVLAAVDSIAALRLLSGTTDGEQIFLNNYYAGVVGGGGNFYWNAASVAADNGGTIIAPTGVSTGRWYRIHDRIMYPEWFGAKGDGVTDDASSISNALAYLGTLSGGILQLGPKTYVIQPSALGDTAAIHLTQNNITIQGVGTGSTILQFLCYNGGTAITTWPIYSGAVLRGHGIYIGENATSSGTQQSNILLRNFTIDGSGNYTGDSTVPASISTGDGWDITHKGIMLAADNYIDNVIIDNCEIRNFRGELIYGAGINIKRVKISNCYCHDTNGDIESISAHLVSVNNEYGTSAASGIEDFTTSGRPCTWAYNYIHDIDQHGICIGNDGATGNQGNNLISHNKIVRCKQNGILLDAPVGTTVTNNYIEDVSNGSSGYNHIRIWDNPPNNPRQIVSLVVSNNICTIREYSSANNAVIGVINGTHGLIESYIEKNRFYLTPQAIASSLAIGSMVSLDAAVDTTVRIYDNRTSNTSTAAYNAPVFLPETIIPTSNTNMLKRDIQFLAQQRVSLSIRVITASTSITVLVEFKDSTGTVQDTTLYNATASVGVVPVSDFTIPANTYLTIYASAGTANQAYLTASIEDG